jgi:hypothetical protein
MSLLDAFRIKSEKLSVSLTQSQIREMLVKETLFDDAQPRGWRYRNEGKRFIGFINEDTFFLIQKPMQGTRFGAVVQGTRVLDSGEPVLEIKSWVDPRATRKLIFGCFLVVFIVARIVREHFFADSAPPPDSVLPYFLLAILPMTALGAHLYDRNRNEAFEHIKSLFKRA